MTFTWRAIGLSTLAALTAVVLPWQVSALLVAAIIGSAIGDAIAVRHPPDVTRRIPDVLSRGVPSEASIRTHRGRTRIRQPTPPDIEFAPPEGTASIEATITALRRGAHHLDGVSTLSIGPLGLGGWYHRTGEPHRVTVFPDLHAARRLAVAVRTGRFAAEGRRARGPIGLGTEFESIREYRPDDDIRQLNARATARTGTPMINRYRIEQDRDVLCVIDCGRSMRAPIAERTRLDAAVDAAAAIAAVADVVGDRIGIVAYSDRVLRHVRPARDNGNVVAWAIHDLEPQPVDSDHRRALQLVGGMKRAFVLVLTDLMDESAARSLSRAMDTVGRRHSLAVAGVRDDRVWSLVTTPAADRRDALETSVAADLMAETRSIEALLAARGARVIEAPLDELSTACVAAYLDAKRRARF